MPPRPDKNDPNFTEEHLERLPQWAQGKIRALTAQRDELAASIREPLSAADGDTPHSSAALDETWYALRREVAKIVNAAHEALDYLPEVPEEEA